MAFNKELDKQLFSEIVEFDGTRITVSVFSYNNGTPKLQLSRENLASAGGEYTFSKLGRLTKDEAEKILPLMQKALKNM